MAHFRPVWGGAGPGLSRPAGPAVLWAAVGGFAAPPGRRPGFPGGPFGGPAGDKNGSPRRGSRCKGSRFYFLRSSPSSTVGMSHSSW